VALNNNQLKAAAEIVATMAVADVTKEVAADLMLVAATTTAVTAATETVMLTVTVAMVTAAMMTALRVSCSQRAALRVYHTLSGPPLKISYSQRRL
jgi:hypothetical protein